MAKLTLTRAFADYGATLINPRWSCSEIASDKSLVFSGWDHLLNRRGDRLYYEDRLSRWTANPLGRERLRSHLIAARSNKPKIRLIIAAANNQPAVDAGEGSRIPKTFIRRDDLVGELTFFDDDRFVFDFRPV